MPEKDIMQAVVSNGLDLANAAGENFVLAITAAYMAGIERGKQISSTPTA